MRFMKIMKDGGPLSKVTGCFLVEIKCLFSIVVLRFDDGARDAYHTHAFNAVSWVLKGTLIEDVLAGDDYEYPASFVPIWTPRDRFHKVISRGTTWAISFRGPWAQTWREYIPQNAPGNRFVTLTHGRKVVP